MHSSIKSASLLVTASCRDVSAHSCSNASDDNKRFSLRNRARNGAGNYVVGRGAEVTNFKRSLCAVNVLRQTHAKSPLARSLTNDACSSDVEGGGG